MKEAVLLYFGFGM